MTTATEIIAALLSGKPTPIVEKTTGLPHGWGIWLRNAPQRAGRLTGEPIQAMVDAAVARPRSSPQPKVPTGRWHALRSLLWQHWDPPPREERGTRWAGGIGSLLLHLGFFALLILVSLLVFPPIEEPTDGTRIQLTFIGRGTQGEGGGSGPKTPQAGAQSAAAAAPLKTASRPAKVAASRPAPAAAQPAAEPPSESQPSAPAPQPELAQQPPPTPQPQPPEPQPTPQPPQPAPAQQPLQVTETPQPTQAFVVPPVTPPQVQLSMPQIQLPPATARVREVEAVQSQQPVVVQQIAPRAMDLPASPSAPTQVRQRDIPNPEPERTVQAPALQGARAAATPSPVQLPQAQPVQARVREIPMPPAPADHAAPSTAAETATSAPAAASAAASTAAAQGTASSAAEQGSASQPSSASANTGAPPSAVEGGKTAGSQANSPGAGAKASAERGVPGPQHADDWGAASKANAGNDGSAGQGLKGLFNADGSAKLPGDLVGGSNVKPGVPGSRQQAKFDADRAGTWLDRPSLGYEPTMFDKYWIPGGTLLQDWVRAGVREMEIPIPGTSKKIRCVVSVLQAGGACGLFDPNKNEQPATARPPPDIPVKRNPIPIGS